MNPANGERHRPGVFKSAVCWLALVLVVPLLLYVVAYLSLVRRVETTLPPQKKITQRVATGHVVRWEMPGILSSWNVFLPIARLDNAYVRPRYWQTYEVNEFPDGRVETNFHLTAWAYARLSTTLGLTNLPVSAEGSRITVRATPAAPPPASSASIPSN